MSTFADFTFYRENGGRLSEAKYNASVNEAYSEIISQTNGRALNASESMLLPVKLCECALVDSIAAYKDTAAELPRGVSSVSNDGYTVSLGSTSLLKTEMQERRAICARYLQLPENLMCRWI